MSGHLCSRLSSAGPHAALGPGRQHPLAAELSPGRQEVAALHSPAEPVPLHPTDGLGTARDLQTCFSCSSKDT